MFAIAFVFFIFLGGFLAEGVAGSAASSSLLDFGIRPPSEASLHLSSLRASLVLVGVAVAAAAVIALIFYGACIISSGNRGVSVRRFHVGLYPKIQFRYIKVYFDGWHHALWIGPLCIEW